MGDVGDSGKMLNAAHRRMLLSSMVNCRTGLHRIRGGLPAGWVAGDKTGNGARGAANDLAIAWPPGRPPVLMALYLDGGVAEADTRAAVQREVAKRVSAAFA